MILADKLFGLVLSGGKSTRMGQDKGRIVYHGIPQREYLYQLLNKVCDRTFLSVRQEQSEGIPGHYDLILDGNNYRGPYNGLLSAHHRFPKAAWLVLACDLPLMDLEALEQLVAERDFTVLATAFAHRDNPLPEPLCAIWEPQGLRESVTYLELGNGTCPRKFLMNNRIKLVFPKNPRILLNANSREEYREALAKLTAL